MSVYSEQEVADSYKMYADYLREEIEKFDKVSTLPLSFFGARREIAARKKAAEILAPVLEKFEFAAKSHAYEAMSEGESFGSQAFR